jgi:hypothetical protein
VLYESGCFRFSHLRSRDRILPMTRLMEQVIEQLRAVPEGQQDRLARFLLKELEEDQRWIRSTADHEGKLKSLVDTVLADDARGECELLDPGDL